MTAIITTESDTTDTVRPVATIGPEALRQLEERRAEFVANGGLEVVIGVREKDVVGHPIPADAGRGHSDHLVKVLEKHEPRLKSKVNAERRGRWTTARSRMTNIDGILAEIQFTLAELIGVRNWKYVAVTAVMKPQPEDGSTTASDKPVKRPTLESFEKAVGLIEQRLQEVTTLIERRDALEHARQEAWDELSDMLTTTERKRYSDLSRSIRRVSTVAYLDRIEGLIAELEAYTSQLQQPVGRTQSKNRTGANAARLARSRARASADRAHHQVGSSKKG